MYMYSKQMIHVTINGVFQVYRNSEDLEQHANQHSLTWAWLLNPCPAEKIKIPHPLRIFSLSDYLIQVIDTNLNT